MTEIRNQIICSIKKNGLIEQTLEISPEEATKLRDYITAITTNLYGGLTIWLVINTDER